MGWKEAQSRRKETSITAPKDEDLIGRKVLNGLGLVERQLLPVCARIFGHDDTAYEAGTWNNTKKLFLYACKKLSHTNIGGLFAPEAHTISDQKEILERFAMWNPEVDNNPRPAFMTRIKGTRQSMTYSIWSADEIGAMLKPVYKVISDAYDGQYQIAVQTTVQFVSQFGPYAWDELVEE